MGEERAQSAEIAQIAMSWVDRWLLLRKTAQHVAAIEASPLSRAEVIGRLDSLVRSVQAAHGEGVSPNMCADPDRLGGGFRCRHEPACDAVWMAFLSDLAEIDALDIAYGSGS